MGHDDVYRFIPEYERSKENVPDDMYELGCPAKGVMSEMGECKKGTADDTGLCYSSFRFEADPHQPCGEELSNRCMCIRPVASEGVGNIYKNIEVTPVDDLAKGRFLRQPAEECGDCSKFRLRNECEDCENCEYRAQVEGSTLGGCVSRVKSGKAHDHIRGPYLHGKVPQQVTIDLVPHYTVWDPGNRESPDPPAEGQDDDLVGPGVPMPYQSWQREPLSRLAWVIKYQEIAPRIQRFLDFLVHKVVSSALHPGQCTPDGELVGKMDRARAAQQACQQTQELAQSFASTQTFEDSGDTNCVRGNAGEEHTSASCQTLNCYTSDKAFNKGLETLKEQNNYCRRQATLAAAQHLQAVPMALNAMLLLSAAFTDGKRYTCSTGHVREQEPPVRPCHSLQHPANVVACNLCAGRLSQQRSETVLDFL